MTAVIKTLAAVPGAASATDSENNTALHLAKTPEIVKILLEAGGSNPRRIKNNDGKTAYEVQTREIRGVIDLYVLFCGRFDIASLSAPEHATATSVVILAIDTFVPEESEEGVEETKGADSPALSRNVVIKLMKEKEVSDREIAQRKGTNPKHVVVGRGRAPRQPTAPRLTNSAPLSSSAALTNTVPPNPRRRWRRLRRTTPVLSPSLATPLPSPTRDPPHPRPQPIVCSSEDDDMKEMWAGELKKLGRWQDYKFGIVMPCAQRNLMVGSLHLSMRT